MYYYTSKVWPCIVLTTLCKTRQVYNGPPVVKFIPAMLSVYWYLLGEKNNQQKYLGITYSGEKKYLGRKKFS